MIAAVIVTCEIGFWVVLGLGMLLRYPLGRARAGAVVLACVPLVDVVLLAAAAVDLGRGAQMSAMHALAAAYLGFSLAFGPSMVRWADVRFAHRFAGGPPPAAAPPAGSPERRAATWAEWFRVVLAAVVASVVLALLALVADPDQRGSVLASAAPLWVVTGFWLLLGPLWEEGSRRPRRDVGPGAARRAPAATGATGRDRGA